MAVRAAEKVPPLNVIGEKERVDGGIMPTFRIGY